MIQRRGARYVLKSKDTGKTLGTHLRKADALAQERAIQIHKALAGKGK